MPELPEVETTKEGIKPYLQDQTINQVLVRNARLRVPVPEQISALCAGKKIISVLRRAKYILIQLSQGHLLIHLGMSGHLRIVPAHTTPEKHDHVRLILNNNTELRFCDPRRFGLFLYLDSNPHQHQLLAHLGPEPLSEAFAGEYLYQRVHNKNRPIKSLIMDNDIVVGVGNIYATESLFLSKIHPETAGKNISREACTVLVQHIKEILRQAIECGGTTLRDYYAFDGKPGYFSIALKVYGRKNLPCLVCTHPVAVLMIGGRSSAFCPNCQNKHAP